MSLPSHRCLFSPRDLLHQVAQVMGGAAMVGGVIGLGAVLGWLPRARPADLDRTVLAAKAELAVRETEAAWVLCGDSSCLMDVDAVTLGTQLGGSIVNLGTLSYLDLEDHAALLAAHLRRRTVAPRGILLLMHPEALRRASAVEGHQAFLRARLGEGDGQRGWDGAISLRGARGFGAVVRERLVQPWVPAVLGGAYGRLYGSNWQLDRELQARDGSLVDPEVFDPQAYRGSAEYRLGAGLEEASRAFRRAVPQGVRLAVGITPVPASFAAANHVPQTLERLRIWSEWLSADDVLAGLPAILPDDQFATVTHLDAEGVAEYTARVAEELRRGGG